MSTKFTRDSFHEQLIAEAFPKRLNRSDSMLLFALLHTHDVNVVSSTVVDAPTITKFVPITQRHCAECLASMWRGIDDERANDTHWYWEWNTDWSYERVDALADRELERFHEIREAIEQHPAIVSLTPEID